jgi:hypothetical protein
MGYGRQEAGRALRFCGGDVSAAVGFVAEQRVKQQVRGARPVCAVWRARPLDSSNAGGSIAGLGVCVPCLRMSLLVITRSSLSFPAHGQAHTESRHQRAQ